MREGAGLIGKGGIRLWGGHNGGGTKEGRGGANRNEGGDNREEAGLMAEREGLSWERGGAKGVGQGE